MEDNRLTGIIPDTDIIKIKNSLDKEKIALDKRNLIIKVIGDKLESMIHKGDVHSSVNEKNTLSIKQFNIHILFEFILCYKANMGGYKYAYSFELINIRSKKELKNE